MLLIALLLRGGGGASAETETRDDNDNDEQQCALGRKEDNEDMSTSRNFFGRMYAQRPNAANVKRPALVVFLHGLGDTGAGWSEAGLNRSPGLEHVTFLYPTAPVKPVTLNMGMPMTAFFDINSLEIETTIEDEKGLREATDALHELIEKEGVEKDRVVVGGFSMGGAVALLAATQVRKRNHTGDTVENVHTEIRT